MTFRRQRSHSFLWLAFLLLLSRKSASFSSFPVFAIQRYSVAAASSEEIFQTNNPQLDYDKDKTYQTNLQIAQLANEGTPAAALKAHALLKQLTYPDTITFNGVLKAYAKSHLPKAALELLDQMELLHDTQSEKPKNFVRPNVISYSTVMDAFCREQNPTVARKILARLVDRYETYRYEDLQPNSIVYNCLLSAYAKSGLGEQAADRSVQLLYKMGDLADVISYNTVLHAIARSGVPQCGEQAQKLLESMQVTPNARTYSTVMDCWARSDREDKADIVHALLHQIETAYNDTGLSSMRPNHISYSVVINSYAHSKDPHKAERAFQVLQHMLHLVKTGANPSAQPSLVTFNSVLNACATSPPQYHSKQIKEIVDTVYETLLLNQYEPDEFTYGTMLKAYANVFIGNPDTSHRVEDIFNAACQAGCVSFGVCYQFKQAASSELFRSILPERAINSQNGHFDVSKLPHEWTRHVKDRSPRR